MQLGTARLLQTLKTLKSFRGVQEQEVRGGYFLAKAALDCRPLARWGGRTPLDEAPNATGKAQKQFHNQFAAAKAKKVRRQFS